MSVIEHSGSFLGERPKVRRPSNGERKQRWNILVGNKSLIVHTKPEINCHFPCTVLTLFS